MKKFVVPLIYKSPLIAAVKQYRKQQDKMKKDFTPTLLDAGAVQFYLARHFGFCYGVENAIEIAYRTIEENPGKRIFLLSEMIHNPQVNADLIARGVQFLQDTQGKQQIGFDTLTPEDIVIIPAFGTTLSIEAELKARGITTEKYNTTCPFVEKVWNRGDQIAEKGYSIVVHGKPKHEETRATFSHASAKTPTVIVNDMNDAIELAKFMTGEKNADLFFETFKDKHSKGFDPTRDLQRIGVINQTTQLASDTQAIAAYLRSVMMQHYKLDETSIGAHFADTRDTLCYATNDNQTAVTALLDTPADLAIVVGGYNSSNTTHLVELCETKLPTYFINGEEKIMDYKDILHFNFHEQKEYLTHDFLPSHRPVKILITSGASCPDALVERIIRKIAGFFDAESKLDTMIDQFQH